MTPDATVRLRKVVYIAGWGRSGSTILGNILGQINGFLHIGELRLVWEKLIDDSANCGCGKTLTDCPFWSGVLARVFAHRSEVDSMAMIRLRDSASRTRHSPLMLSPMGKRIIKKRLAGYLPVLSGLYSAIESLSGSHVIVDSSKTPGHGFILTMLPEIELHLVHLIRDPRATAYSWRKRNVQVQGGDYAALPQYGIVKNALSWMVWNYAIERLWSRSDSVASYQILRYEDFSRHPEGTLLGLLDGMGEAQSRAPVFANDEIWIDRAHTVSGNPVRFRRGRVKIQPDMEWKEKSSARERWLTTCLTWPLLVRYGYLGVADGSARALG